MTLGVQPAPSLLFSASIGLVLFCHFISLYSFLTSVAGLSEIRGILLRDGATQEGEGKAESLKPDDLIKGFWRTTNMASP